MVLEKTEIHANVGGRMKEKEFSRLLSQRCHLQRTDPQAPVLLALSKGTPGSPWEGRSGDGRG